MWHKSQVTTCDLETPFVVPCTGWLVCQVAGSEQFPGYGSTAMREVRRLYRAKTVDQTDTLQFEHSEVHRPPATQHALGTTLFVVLKQYSYVFVLQINDMGPVTYWMSRYLSRHRYRRTMELQVLQQSRVQMLVVVGTLTDQEPRYIQSVCPSRYEAGISSSTGITAANCHFSRT